MSVPVHRARCFIERDPALPQALPGATAAASAAAQVAGALLAFLTIAFIAPRETASDFNASDKDATP